jgi:hypothetical protein
MIRNVTIRKASSDDPPLFEVAYFDIEKKEEEGYSRTTKYGTEPLMRELLKSCGVLDAEIDDYFETAKS